MVNSFKLKKNQLHLKTSTCFVNLVTFQYFLENSYKENWIILMYVFDGKINKVLKTICKKKIKKNINEKKSI